MNSFVKGGLFLTIITLFSAAGRAQEFELKSFAANIQGTSSLHDWQSAITRMEWKGSFLIENNDLKNVTSAEITIPVVGIKSEKGKIMDNKTYDAFQYEKHPNVTFELTSSTLKRKQAGAYLIDATGYLTMAGTKNVITLTGSINVLANGEVQLTLSRKLNMTDFKMKPPTAVLGTITVGNEVSITFNLTLKAAHAEQ